MLTLPNLRDKLRQEVLRRVDRILADLRVEMRPLTEELQIGEQFIVRNALHNKTKEQTAVEKLIGILNEEYYAGHLDTMNDALCLDGDNLDRRFKILSDDTLVLRTSGQEIEDRIHDDKKSEISNGSINVFTYVDEAYMDSLIAPYKTPEGARLALFAAKDAVAEKKFRNNVFKAYDAQRGELAWCVVSGQWHNSKHVKIFDIVNHSMGEPTAQHLFGPLDNEDGHLMGAKNGLPMHRVYAEAFCKRHLVLLPKGGPDDDQGSFSRWKVLFWGEFDRPKSTAKSTRKGLPWGSQLDGRVLQFQNQFRPATRYLFLLYCMDILLRQRYEAPGWWRTCCDSSSASESSKVTYLRASTLVSLARRRCLLTKEEAVEFAAHNTFPRAPDDSDEDEGIEAGNDEVMDDSFAEILDGPVAPPTSLPLTGEWNFGEDEDEDEDGEFDDGGDEIEIEGEIDVYEKDEDEWEDVDDEYEWGDGWVNLDEDVDEDTDEDGDGDRDIY